MTTLVLIRHGESEANRKKIFAGWHNARLQDNGIKQAELTAKYIAENYKIDKIYSSDLKRAYSTSEKLSEILNMEVMPENGIREISAGKWEGIEFEKLASTYKEEYDTWLNHIGSATCPGGESVKELGARVMKTLTRIAEDNDGKTIAVFTHATPIRAMQSIIETGDTDQMENIPWVSNASVTEVKIQNGKWNIEKTGIDSHLEDTKTTLPANV